MNGKSVQTYNTIAPLRLAIGKAQIQSGTQIFYRTCLMKQEIVCEVLLCELLTVNACQNLTLPT